MDENKKTILVVDDEEYIRRLINRILGDAGYNVFSAASGKEALERLAGTAADMVLLDIKMPEMDGFQTLEIIRKRYSIPVIMVTGVGEVMPDSGSLPAVPDDYVKKPFQSKELIAKIKEVLAKSDAPKK
jgi:DNA-binding response OmpR family regulator